MDKAAEVTAAFSRISRKKVIGVLLQFFGELSMISVAKKREFKEYVSNAGRGKAPVVKIMPLSSLASAIISRQQNARPLRSLRNPQLKLFGPDFWIVDLNDADGVEVR